MPQVLSDIEFKAGVKISNAQQLLDYQSLVVLDGQGNVKTAPPPEAGTSLYTAYFGAAYNASVNAPLQNAGIENTPGAYAVRATILIHANHYRQVGSAREHYAMAIKKILDFTVYVDTTPGNNHYTSDLNITNSSGSWIRYNRIGTAGSSVIASGVVDERDIEMSLVLINTYANIQIKNTLGHFTELPTQEQISINGQITIEKTHHTSPITIG
jgi:hypothetical protein